MSLEVGSIVSGQGCRGPPARRRSGCPRTDDMGQGPYGRLQGAATAGRR